MSVRLVLAGDLCASGRVGTALSSPERSDVWRWVEPILGQADLSVVNLECPLVDAAPRSILKSGPSLRGPIGAARGVAAAGFTAVSLANNHILDAGPAGLISTIEACREAGLLCFGAGESLREASRPLRVTRQRLDIALMAVAENEFSTTRGDYPGASPVDLISNASQVLAERANCDFLVVILHGGAELYSLPSPEMQRRCRFFVELGADAVICHHTHVPGAYELYRDRPIVYGLGNFLFDCPEEPSAGWYSGYLAELALERGSAAKLSIIPYVQDPAAVMVRGMQEGESSVFFERLDDLNRLLADPVKLEASWSSYCRERGPDVVSSLLCLTRPESWLLGKGVLPTAKLRLSQRRLACLRNLFTCETHLEVCQRFLEDMLQRPNETGSGT